MADEIRINGNAVSWGSIVLKFGGERFSGFDQINYGHKLEVGKAYGMGPHHAPVARSKGKYVPEPVKIRGLKSSFRALRDTLAAASADGRSYGTVPFEAVVEYIEAGNTPILDELVRCRLVGETSNNEESPDPLKEEAELDIMYLLRDGKTMFDSSKGLP